MLGVNFNLREQLTFYGSYHHNFWNQLIHFIFVPVIFWTASIWLAYTPELFHIDWAGKLGPDASNWALYLASCALYNGAFVLAAGYSLYYVILEPVAGLSWSLFIGVPTWLGAEAFRQSVPHAWAWALGLHVFAWFMQIVPGHSWAERRKPALIDSFLQSLVLAPLFVWFELLFLLGYRPSLKADIDRAIAANIAVHRAGIQPLLAGDR